jgi:hypothetical protein
MQFHLTRKLLGKLASTFRDPIANVPISVPDDWTVCEITKKPRSYISESNYIA